MPWVSAFAPEPYRGIGPTVFVGTRSLISSRMLRQRHISQIDQRWSSLLYIWKHFFPYAITRWNITNSPNSSPGRTRSGFGAIQSCKGILDLRVAQCSSNIALSIRWFRRICNLLETPLGALLFAYSESFSCLSKCQRQLHKNGGISVIFSVIELKKDERSQLLFNLFLRS